MPVQPPYSLIDSIAQLRASGGAAWGDAAQNIGRSIGGGLAQAGQNSREDVKTRAAQLHDATLAFDQAHDEVTHVPMTPAQPAQAAVPQTGGPLRMPAAPPPPSAMPTTMSGILAPAPAAPSPYQPVAGGTPAAPAQPAKQDTSNLVNMADWMQKRGIKPAAGMENIWGQPKMTTREAAAGKSAAAENVATTKAAAEKEKTTQESATKLEVARINAKQRAHSSETAAEAKKAVAQLGKEGKQTVAQAQKDIQALKNSEMTQEDYAKAKEKSPFYYDLAESLGVIEPPATKKPAAAASGGSAEGPLGATTKKGGKTYVWSAETGKYHLQAGE